jgi:integrase
MGTGCAAPNWSIHHRARRADDDGRLPQDLGKNRRGKRDDIPSAPHKLRHAAGYKLANQGVDTRSSQHYLGHKNIQHTTRYTELAADRFKNFWRD